MPREIVIVSGEDHALYEYLREAFAGQEETRVILDRRLRERRQPATGPVAVERRQRDRRARPHVEADLRSLGFGSVRLQE